MIEKLIIGTVQFGIDYGITNTNGKIDQNELDKIFIFCNENNIICFDTAQDYGNSEDIMSKYCKIYPNIKIITKSKFKNKNKPIEEIICNSFNKFNYIECFMLHSYEDYENHELMNTILKYKSLNKIKKIGVSIYTVYEGIKLIQDNLVDVIQIPFNYLDNQWFNKQFQDLILTHKHIEIHVRSIFLQGLLLNKPVKYPTNIHKNDFDFLENNILEICQFLNLSKLELCFSYINTFDWIDKFLIGIDNLQHLKLNYDSINKNLKLNKEEILFINKKIKHVNINIINPTKWVFN
jgi:aryl-alcohol dehydrogenase-like predicted oxidoreductase